MFLVQSRVDLPSTSGGQANVTLSRLVRRANCVAFACDTFKYNKKKSPIFESLPFLYKSTFSECKCGSLASSDRII